MATELTQDEIERARELRRAGKGFHEIKELLGTDADPSSIRQHCSDIDPATGSRSYERKAGVVEATNRTIRPFTEEEDERLIAWNDWDEARAGPRPVLNIVAKGMERKRHSALARLKTLKRRGKIDALRL